jgi:hypothetical protein
MENLQNDSSPEELLGIPVEHATLFANHKNVYKRRIEKRQTKFIEKLSCLKPFLQADERVTCVTTAHSPMTVLEQFLMGWIIFFLKQCLLVFTNKRVLHIPTKSNYSYRNCMAQILYADCQSIAVRGGTLVVKYASDKKEKFYHVASKERKKIKSLLKTVSLEGQQSVARERTHLCPRCTAELIKDRYTCPNCKLKFKNKAEARKISIIYPGGGYFYTRHPVLGLGDAFVELILMTMIITSLIDAMRGTGDADFSVLFFWAIVLAIEKAVTVHDSNKFINEYIPLEKEIKPLEQLLELTE